MQNSIYYMSMSSRDKNNNLQFGLTIPQGWRGGDLPLEEGK